jgi:hypothetical protein
MDKEFIPHTCDECIKSKFKRILPECAHEQGIAHKKTYQFFKDKYGIEMPQHLDEMAKCKIEREQCLQDMQQKARDMIALRQGLGIDQLLHSLTSLNKRVLTLEDTTSFSTDAQDRILASPNKDWNEESTTKTVLSPRIKPKIKKKQYEPENEPDQEYETEQETEDEIERYQETEDETEKYQERPVVESGELKKKTSMAERGWLTYIRNCKKENVRRYVEKLKHEHPDLRDSQIDIGINGQGNRMIRYTLNKEISKK